MATDKVEFITSPRGNKLLHFKEYLHSLERVYGNKTYWKCVNYSTFNCKGRAHTVANSVVKYEEHNHSPDVAAVEARKTVFHLKVLASTTELPTSSVLAEGCSTVTPNVATRLPALPLLKRTINRINRKRRHTLLDKIHSHSFSEDIISDEFATNLQGIMATRLDLCHLLPSLALEQLARDWLREDVPGFDYGGFVVGERVEHAALFCKSPGVLAGSPFFDAVFRELGCTVAWACPDGTWVEPVTKVAWVQGKARHLLLGERVALNCLSRCSGIATAARRVVDLAKDAKWHGEVAGTRKTTPGFRLVEKYAMLVGGASSHRYDLGSLIMLKDNHIWSAGNITQAVQDARTVGGFSLKIEVECGSLTDAREAAQAGAEIVMLDNFLAQEIHSVAQALKSEFPRLTIEASGGIKEDNIVEFFGPYVDVISLGSLTQAFQVVDFSLKITKEQREVANSNCNNNNNSGKNNNSATVGGGTGVVPTSPTMIPSTAAGRLNFAF